MFRVPAFTHSVHSPTSIYQDSHWSIYMCNCKFIQGQTSQAITPFHFLDYANFFSCFNFFVLLFSLLWLFNIQTNITSRTSWDAKIDKNSMINLKQSVLLKLENHKSCRKKKKDIYEDEKKENEVVRRRGEEKIFGKRAWGRSCFHLHSDGNTANETFIHLTYNLKVFKNQLHLFSL